MQPPTMPPPLMSQQTNIQSNQQPNWIDDDNSSPPSSNQDQQHQQQQQQQGGGGGQQTNVGELPSLMSMKVDKPEDIKSLPNEVILPKALEDVFAFKDQLAGELGRKDGELPIDSDNRQQKSTTGVISTDYADADADSDDDDFMQATDMTDSSDQGISKMQSKLDKNKKKKRRKKQNRQQRQANQRDVEDKRMQQQQHGVVTLTITNNDKADKNASTTDDISADIDDTDDITVEYVPDKITVAELAPMYRQFYRVFEIFKLEDKPAAAKELALIAELEKSLALKREKDKQAMEEDEEDMEEDKKDDKEKLSKRKMKKLTRLSVAELKQLVQRPDVVEMHDVTARDPKLLVQLKAHRNTVQVPRHWCFKRKYLQGKRGIEKPPFDLPAFIKKTGIMEMRASLQEKDESKTLKAKMRERARPKMGKIDIDYQKLHDAFFKWQTKPRMTIHGDLYYEGKEFETRLKEKKPGDLSEELRTALGMPIGPNCHKIPPPWLIAQQRYGPPPSYPNLKIPGLNAPIPDGTSFGYHAGGWGKPPVDEKGKPLYGDVFGTNALDPDSGVDEGDIDRNIWGELESESEESSEEEEEEGEDLGNVVDESGLVTPAEGLVTPSGLTSVPAGMETPDTIELRKKKIENEMEE